MMRRGHWRAEPWVGRAAHEARTIEPRGRRPARARRRVRDAAGARGHQGATGRAVRRRCERAPAGDRFCLDHGRSCSRDRAVRGGRQGGRRSPRSVDCHPARRRARPRPSACSRTCRWWYAGPMGAGAPGMMCATCRHAANFDVPACPDTRTSASRRGRSGWQPGARCSANLRRAGSRIARATAAATSRPWSGYGRGLARRLGVVARCRPRTRAGHAGGVRHAGAGLGRRGGDCPAPWSV